MTQLMHIITVLAALLSSGALSAITVQTPEEANPTGQRVGRLKIYSRIDQAPWRHKSALYPRRDQNLSLKVDKRAGAEIRWYLIFADLTRIYANANPPWERDAYKWVGLDKIGYYRTELVELRNQWVIAPFSSGAVARLWTGVEQWFRGTDKDTSGLYFYQSNVGTFWFAAEVEKDGVIRRSPGLEAIADRGLSPRVLRVSVRESEGYLGYLTSFYNVPGLFGSTLYQSRHHLGADCADILMAAWSKWKRKPLKQNYNVQRLTDTLVELLGSDLDDGLPVLLDRVRAWQNGPSFADDVSLLGVELSS